jgi:hypothetical protein
MSAWQRQYRARGAHPFPRIFVGCVLGALGLVFGLLVFPWGFALWILAIGVPLAMAYFGTDTTIIAGPEGFSVTTESKRSGRSAAQFAWQEVTGTRYEEYASQSSEGSSRTTRYFSVETARGPAFRIDSGISQFDDLIQVFNFSTPHLPYVWQKQAGFQVTIGALSAGRQAYVQVPRAA